MKLLLPGILLALCLAASARASKILFLIPMASKSQRNTFDPLIEALARRNHEITVITNIPWTKQLPGVKAIFLEGAHGIFQALTNSNETFSISTSSPGVTIFKIFQVFAESIDMVYGDPLIRDFVRDPGPFDVTIMNVMSEAFMPIAHKIGAPVVLVSPPALLPQVAWDMDIPNPLSYVPFIMTSYKPEMTFLQRLVNMATTISWLVVQSIMLAMNGARVQKYLPTDASAAELARNVSLVLVNTHFSFDAPRPGMPNLIEVGGMHCRPAEKLPQELETFTEGSGEDGFIVFSMGSILQGQFLPDHMVEAFKYAFSKVKQRVIWKYEKPLEGLSPNVMLAKWIPQQDLMANPKCRLAITHGGIASLQEVAYHGVPLLGVPIGMDRDGNINQAIDKGFADLIDWKTVTPEGLLEKITSLLTDKRYKENAAKVSSLMKDRPQPPLETAVYWVEYVIRHKGAKHLKSAAGNLNFFQYFLLDVIAALLLSLVAGVAVLVFIVKRLIRLCSAKKPAAKKVKTK